MLLTVRDEAASSVAERVADHTGTTPHRVVVGELLDAEMAQVLQAFPALAPLGRNPRASALLLRRPYLIELLIRAVARSGLPPNLVGEEDLVDVVTARLVRRDDGGPARPRGTRGALRYVPRPRRRRHR